MTLPGRGCNRNSQELPIATKEKQTEEQTMLKQNYLITRVLQKVLSLGSDYFSATFYQTYFYYKPSKYSPFICNLFTPSRKADK